MNKRRWLCLAATVLALPTILHAQTPLGTAFTYQGQLKRGGVPVNETCDFLFVLWDDPELAGPAHNKGEAGQAGVQVGNGLFALKLDFGSGAFDGSARWLEAHVCCPSGSCGEAGWEILSPRQELTPTPYALHAASADGGVGGFWSASEDHIYSTNSGNVGIGTTNPQATLDVAGHINAYNSDGVGVRGHSGSDDGVVGRSDSSEKSGVFGNSIVGTGVSGRSEAVGGYGVAGYAVGQDGRGVYGTATSGVGVYGHSDAASAIEGHNSSTSEWTPAIYGQNQGAGDGVYGWSQGRYGVTAVTYSPDPNQAAIWAKNNGAGSGILAEAGSGGYAGVFSGWIKANVVEITGGSDLSEQFDITRGQHEAVPGMVVCIDPKNPGHLAVSTRSHDRTVAGIVSGAGGVKPGMIMGQEGSAANGEHAVALTGRVWAYCDVSNGPIHPGDLLTTSSTPGHAMKATDDERARGAILGKAMTGLSEGKGLVLVLVALQ